MEWGDPYPKQFEETASALAKRCGLHQWSIAYQSAGGGRGTWLGPALNDVLAELIGTGYRAIVLAPLGFVMDHLEVLYDLDRDAVQMGREHGVEVTRARMPNDDPLLVRPSGHVRERRWLRSGRRGRRSGRRRRTDRMVR
jgi:ferrochelatase